jgi:hypothetical protein
MAVNTGCRPPWRRRPACLRAFQAINLALEVLSDKTLRQQCGGGAGVGALGPKYSFLRDYLLGHGFAGGEPRVA